MLRVSRKREVSVRVDHLLFVGLGVLLCFLLSQFLIVARADNFTDLFHTDSFRGSFEWVNKFDWVGVIVQAAISILSLIGTALLIIQIMTSLLYLSAKGLWEEVSDLKNGMSSEDTKFWGAMELGKTWFKGKAGTGLDAIIGFVLILLPDVKKYSYFNQRSGHKFDEDVTVGQFMLKISLPVIIAVFFFAMGFNGTLVRALAVTVDGMGQIAETVVGVNYAGIIEDFVNSNTGFNFTFGESGTSRGELQQDLANSLYSRAIAVVNDPSDAQLETIGRNVESVVNNLFNDPNWFNNASGGDAFNPIAESVRTGLAGGLDHYYSYVQVKVIENSSSSVSNGEFPLSGGDGGAGALKMDTLLEGTGVSQAAGVAEKYLHVFFESNDTSGSNFGQEFTVTGGDGTNTGGTNVSGGSEVSTMPSLNPLPDS